MATTKPTLHTIYKNKIENLPPEHQAFTQWITDNYPQFTYSIYQREILEYTQSSHFIALQTNLTFLHTSSTPAYCVEHKIDLADPEIFQKTKQWLDQQITNITKMLQDPTIQKQWETHKYEGLASGIITEQEYTTYLNNLKKPATNGTHKPNTAQAY